jgi:hypothetical protein
MSRIAVNNEVGKEHEDDHISDSGWETYSNSMFPSKPLEGELLSVLKDHLDSGFIFRDSMSQFCELCAAELGGDFGLKWLNAYHDLGGPECDDPPCTPLSYVVKEAPRDWRMVNFLIYCGADPNLRDGEGKPPLYVVLESGEGWKTAQSLMANGASPFATYNGKSIAFWAKKWKGNNETMGLIWQDMEQKFDVEEECHAGECC